MKRILLLLFAFSFFSCNVEKHTGIQEGVSIELAHFRSERISHLEYHLELFIPLEKDSAITAKMLVELEINNAVADLIMDFNAGSDRIKEIRNDEQAIDYIFDSGHISIPAKYLFKGKNKFEFTFELGNEALNRQDDFLYSLFVPNKASTAFPCFDQPDLKAVYHLSMNVPKGWEAVSSGQLLEKYEENGRQVYRFRETKPISTYVFGFVAGKFQKKTKRLGGKTYNFFYRETNKEKLDASLDKIFELHAKSILWMEEYTEINYPFNKLDFIAIPNFQYSGMEHSGAILYRAEKLFLDKTATINQLYDRSNVIAHETSHMWFGDLVTMRWFDDVWLKEIFANFFAARITNPNFPEFDYEMIQLTKLYPKAYQVDRTKGTNAIKQELKNLSDAGSLYGNIIYYKAPIIMQQLEHIMGEKALRNGLKEYLNTYKFTNANWDELIAIFEKHTSFDLKKWSDVWVKTPGMPIIDSKLRPNNVRTLTLELNQTSSLGDTTLWPQQLSFLWSNNHRIDQMSFHFSEAHMKRKMNIKITPEYYFMNGNGLSYGAFLLNKNTIDYLLKETINIPIDLVRGIAIIDLYENFLYEKISPESYMYFLNRNIQNETNIQILELILDQTETVFWRFLTTKQQQFFAELFEKTLLNKIQETDNQALKRSYYSCYLRIFITESEKARMYNVWYEKSGLYGLKLNSDDYTNLAYALAVRDEHTNLVLKQQAKRLEKTAKYEQFLFISKAVSDNNKTRDDFFKSLSYTENRKQEQWVREALVYLNHPLRQKSAQKYINPALSMIQEIKQTGSIFFPTVWVESILSGHSSNKAAFNLEYFMNSNTQMDRQLRNKIIQAGDMLDRSVKIKSKYYQE